MAVTAKDVIKVMQDWIGTDKRKIIDIYNAHTPLAQGYKVQYSDAWCDTTVSACFIKLNATDLIGGTECGVERHIALFKKKGIWNEDGNITPRPGDIVCYNWDDSTQPNDGFADHIGIVEKVDGKQITVIEGNYNNAVKRRVMSVGWGYIRGYAQPKYAADSTPSVKPSPAPSSSKMDLTKPIVDVSEWQAKIDWETLKPHIGGAILRVAYGANRIDNYITRNLNECDRLGIPFGVYLYSLAYTESMAEAEAKKALEIVKGKTLTLPIYIDLEVKSYGYMAKTVAKVFCNIISKAGYKYGIYAGESYFNNYLRGHGITGVSLWIAKYGATNDGYKHEKPNIGSDYSGWQYTSRGKLPGIPNYEVPTLGFVDLSEFYTTFSGEVPKPSPEPSKMTIDQVADEVIAGGIWGNGEVRIKRLTDAGYDANAVQRRVNEKLGASTTVTYKVKNGDTLSAIAAKYGLSYLKIAADNGITNPNLIHVGQLITIKR